MHFRSLLAILLLGASLPALGAAQTVNLREAERIALERNLSLQGQAYDTRASEALVRKGYGIYDPLASFSFVEGEQRDQSNSQFFSGATGAEFRQFDFSLTQKLPTGADLTLSFNNQRNRIFTPPKPPINPSYDSELRLSLTQPLLRDFGRTVTEQGILFAVKDREISLQDLRDQAFQLLVGVRDAYFNVLRYRDNLEYRRTSVELAATVLEENRLRVKAGVLPPVEELEAEVGLRTRERELLDAEREYRDALDTLAVLVNAGGELQVAEETLGVPAVQTDEREGFLSALEKRPDLQRRVREIERLALQKKIARNQTLPALDLVAGYAQKGLGEDYSDDMDMLITEDLRDWEIGMIVTYPLGNREARNEYRRTDLQLKGSRARLGQLREEVRAEIRSAIRLLEVNSKKIEVARRGRELAEEKLRMLIKRKEVGLATTREVLEGEEDLALARTDQIAALADYNQAITEYLRVTGTLLEHEGIYFSGPVTLEEGSPLLRMN
ncbi:hypothetical protein DESUT3_17610 [Desulfuromonas versatilis]|uniref:Outer membrane efflux protein n=1 Tax=Desulfuromonas versatilis TaxID=2802975 RepID=A0ABN6DXE4_9BACT|nr:TolC family protein [Desulfuromonas versatilis]BCR04692.1 hypothetical protein DESUT3_17610 [Desulfuromonas versatilis]